MLAGVQSPFTNFAAVRYLLLICVYAVWTGQLSAQPLPCEDPPTMTSFCAEACIICDIDGFTGRHESTVSGEAPDGFCTFVVHNAQWIAFIAGSTDLRVGLEVSNCEQGFGLEFALYKSLDCTNFEQISNCFGGVTNTVGPGQTGVIENTEPLVIGQYYYIVMDGARADNCDWTFSVLEGSTAVDPLVSSGAQTVVTPTCPEVRSLVTTEPQVGATRYDWTIDGVEVPDSIRPLVLLSWPGAGIYTVCVTASNACDAAPPSCVEVTVEPLDPTTLTVTVCDDESYALPDGTSTDQSGNYDFPLLSVQGCDSLVQVDLTVLPASLTALNLRICDGDTLYLADTPYFATGSYSQLFTTYQGCDSTVTLDLNVIDCNITGTAVPTAIACHGDSTGQLTVTALSGTPVFVYRVENLLGEDFGSGFMPLDSTVTITDLPAGTYLVLIADRFGNTRILIQEIEQPASLADFLTVSSYTGFNLSCADATDGFLQSNTTGGTPPYSYLWSTGSTDPALTDLPPGPYTLTVTDAEGCERFRSAELFAPPALALTPIIANPDCAGPLSGVLGISATGGSGNFLYDLGTGLYTAEAQRTNVGAGTYLLAVEDQNGCRADTSITLAAPVFPQLFINGPLTLRLGDSLRLAPSYNVAESRLRWVGTEYLSCTDCARPVVRPYRNTSYTLYATSADGCVDSVSVAVTVQATRDLYAPNAFSPNGDGVNERFRLYPDRGAAELLEFRVFDRWGGQVYEALDADPQNQFVGWDGRSREQPAGPGVYVWMARIRYLDGLVVDYGGDVLLLR